MRRNDTMLNVGDQVYDPEKRLILSAHCGRVNTYLRIFRTPAFGSAEDSFRSIYKNEKTRIYKDNFRNAQFESLTAIIETALAASGGVKPLVACIAVAGPVEDNRCMFAPLTWEIDGARLQSDLGIAKVVVINSYLAQAYGVPLLNIEEECITLQKGNYDAKKPAVIVGAGTGLGEAFMTTASDGTHQVWPSEGGHSDFASRQRGDSQLWFEMIKYLMIKFSAFQQIDVERIVSNQGIAHIYEFLAWKFPDNVNMTVHKEFMGKFYDRMDPMVVVEAARSGRCELCLKAVNIFTEAYGAECGVMALRYLPFGGIFVTGGVTFKTQNFLVAPGSPFMSAFLDKNRLSPLMEEFPVHVVTVEDVGERGAFVRAVHAFRGIESRARARKLAIEATLKDDPDACCVVQTGSGDDGDDEEAKTQAVSRQG
eukprot:NODE_8952_length_1457_cov_9.955639.p1 GENE.NODE_8952_length_1457_cov_9.955639~~NODE_8952_length_1457_cov_9.955639.p1  ORF type:complete len:425 (+),score=119.36 NODE_8952_length_1457_cov_9.955639:47-1321(+)